MFRASITKQAARLVIVLSVGRSPQLLLSADQQGKGQARTASQSHIPTSAVPFDTQNNYVQPHFRGHDAEMIYEAAEKNLPDASQSEFESKSEFNARMLEVSDKPFWGNMKASDQFAFVLGQPQRAATPMSGSGDYQGSREGDLGSYYDAEGKKMSIGIPRTALWRRVLTPSGSYIGENAFGVRRVVKRANVKDTDIVVEGSDWLDFFCEKAEPDYNSCSFEMDAQQAQSFSRDAMVILTGHLAPPFVSSEDDVSEPSIDIPVEFRRSHRHLHLQLDQLWIVNGASGQVIKKYSRAQQASEYSVNVEFRMRNKGSFSYPDPRCDPFGHRSDIVELQYSVDGDEYKYGSPKKISARHFVDVKIVYCDIPRVAVFLNGQPYELQCEKQDQFIEKSSQCTRVQPVGPR